MVRFEVDTGMMNNTIGKEVALLISDKIYQSFFWLPGLNKDE